MEKTPSVRRAAKKLKWSEQHENVNVGKRRSGIV
jgi:hypothetical protein